ncbi:ABC transporter ATP-binding protein [Actinophytocola xanthii]|uniref:Fatty acid ABC transporter ATP-binding/permease protein n=1 Tax=Actinophytocola xanthii TaxID=1912961 RepID=A0A1Q8CS56_9PSEU|nr:ABC transporter ATP-binding protein [Actinophytocola xanthii]OLF17188.1 multidrug ABC transporter ATP-binding protein [Actinophytocola xanthii]
MTAPTTEDRPAVRVRAGRRLLAQLAPYRVHLVAVALTGLVGVLAGTVAAPAVLGRATDVIFAGAVGAGYPPGLTAEEVVEREHAAGNHGVAEVLGTVDLVPGRGVDLAALGRLAAVLLALYAVAFVLSTVQERMAALVVRRVVFDLREAIAAKLTRLPVAYFDSYPRGELQSRLTNDVDNVQQALQKSVGVVFTKVFVIVGVLVMMFVISPLLAVVVLATLPLSGVVGAVIARRAERRYADQWAATGELAGHVEETYAGHQLVTVLGRRRQVVETFDECNERTFDSGLRGQVSSGAMEPAMLLVGNLTYILIAVVGALRVVSGSLSIGAVQAFAQYAGHFGNNAGMLAAVVGELQSGIASARRVYELLDAEEEEPDRPAAERLAPVRGRVVFDRVSFAYTPGVPVLTDVSFTVEPGQTVAVVGPTGAGKTTLANLLLRFHEPESGRILLDDTDIATLPRAEVRRATGLVLQDSWLFAGTIADNIAYGQADATRADVVAAARAARVDQFVRALPEGYDTVLGESAGISAGERQLVTVARAFVADPAILVLDEATSSVDSRSEVLLQRAMRSLRAGRTCFVIAHRLSTIRHADLILLLDGGRIVERGSHEQLVALDGAYARLYASHAPTP